MKFLYPEFLWALAALIIPVIIHLFNFRRYKVVFFSNLRFLRTLQEQTRSQQKLKHLLVLLARLLALAFLVLIFAQPYLPAPDAATRKSTHAVSVFIDNSFSMTNASAEGELLEVAKNKACEIARSYKPGDKFQLLTNDFEARHQHLVSRDNFMQLVDEVALSTSSRRLPEVLVRMKQALSKAGDAGKDLYILSDFQRSQVDAGRMEKDSSVRVHLLPLPPVLTANLSVDSCWFTTPYIRPSDPASLVVRIRNTGNEAVTGSSVTLKINRQQKALAGFNVQGHSYTDVPMTFTPAAGGNYEAELSVADNPVTFDDQLFFTFAVRTQVNVLHLYGQQPNKYVSAVFASDPYCNVTPMSEGQIDYTVLGRQQLVVLDAPAGYSSGLMLELNKFMQGGGSVVVLPPADKGPAAGAFAQWVQTLGLNATGAVLNANEPVQQVETQSNLLKDVFEKVPRNLDMPVVQQYYALGQGRSRGSQTILGMRSGDALLLQLRREKGNMYLFAVPADAGWSKLPESWLFVPLMLRMAYTSQHMGRLYYTIGRDDHAMLPAAANTGEASLRLQLEKEEFIPAVEASGNQVQVFFHDMAHRAGNYAVLRQQTEKEWISFNYDRAESSTEYIEGAELDKLAAGMGATLMQNSGKPLAAQLETGQRGEELWKLCVLLTLVFLLIEILLLKFYPG